MSLLFLVEHEGGQIDDAVMGSLTGARQLASQLGVELHAVLIDPDAESAVNGLDTYGVEHIHVVSHELLTDYGPDAWAESLHQLARSSGAVAVMATGTDRGNEVMAQVGARMDLAMVANCLDIEPDAEDWVMTRVRWGGSLHEKARLSAPVKLATLAPHHTNPTSAGKPASGTVSRFTPDLDQSVTTTLVVERTTVSAGITLATAPVVVSGGRGVGSAEAFDIIEELADLLGGAVGCSRVVTNNGWKNHKFQVGQTGTVVAPDLYIACGISGAIQHWVGMMNAKNVLAINTDLDAPMVTKANWAIIADLHQVVPAISAEISRRQALADEST